MNRLGDSSCLWLDVIEARTTRPHLIRWLELLETKHETRPRTKHGNIPL